MKQNVFSLLILTIILAYSNITFGQKTYTQAIATAIEKSVLKEYNLLDKGGFNIYGDKAITTDLAYYKKGKEYMFIGVVDDCKDCKLSLKFGTTGQIPAYQPDVEYIIDRPKTSSTSTIMYKFIPSKSTDGVFALFNKSSKSRYTYIMLFVKK